MAEHAKAVAFAGQVASNAQLFLQQLKADGFTGKLISTDGTFDNTKFTVPGRVHLVVLARHPPA